MRRLKSLQLCRLSVWGMLALICLVVPSQADAIEDIEVADTYFSRFLKEGLVKGSSPGKFRLLYLHGRDTFAAGIGAEVPFGTSSPDTQFIDESGSELPTPPWFAHDIAILTYRIASNEFDDDAKSFNLSYGLAARYIPFLGSIHAGVNWNWGSHALGDPNNPLEETHRLVPYLYIDSTPFPSDDDRLPVSYRVFALPNDAYDDLSKVILEFGLFVDWFELGVWYERTKQQTQYLQEYSIYGFVPMSKSESGFPSSGIRFRAGNAFPEGADFGNSFSDPDTLFGVVELTGAWVLGVSYREDIGPGFRFGLDYAMDASVTGFGFSVKFYYARNFINDSVLGQIVDPSMFVIGLGIQ